MGCSQHNLNSTELRHYYTLPATNIAALPGHPQHVSTAT